MTTPTLVYGTAWKKEETARLVELAVDSGFAAIDTANQLIHYQESLVGEALLALQKKGVGREKLWLQTKFTSPNGQGGRPPYDPASPIATQVATSFESSLQHLHTDRLDSYVLHGPYVRRGLSAMDWEVWGAIEALQRTGRTEAVGISNVAADQLELLCAKATVKPRYVQNRCYAVMGWDYDVREICRREGIVYQGFSLLTANQEYLGAPAIRAIAARLGATIPQVIFRFSQQIGMLPLTGTTNPVHMKEDLKSDSFTLTDAELKQIETVAL